MGLKRSIVLIGSVLVLAACDSVSAPTGPLSLNQSAASARKADTTSTTRTNSLSASCGFIKQGADSILVCDEPQLQ